MIASENVKYERCETGIRTGTAAKACPACQLLASLMTLGVLCESSLQASGESLSDLLNGKSPRLCIFFPFGF